MKNWHEIVVTPECTLRMAMRKIDTAGMQFVLVADDEMSLKGVLTDGDIRRAILSGIGLDSAVSESMNKSPYVCSVGTTRGEIRSLMRRYGIHHFPMIDIAGRLCGLATLDEYFGAVERDNWVVLMAGGLGARLLPLTENCPKPMLPIGGKPILEGILERFTEQGFRRFFISVNYKAEMIKDYFGNGERWGVQIDYLHENERLGTAGALSLLPAKPNAPLLVMNGDLITSTNFSAMLDYHEDNQAVATMAVREYDLQVPYGVVSVDGVNIVNIEEKPVHQFFVNGGIYVLSSQALERIPNTVFFDMPSLFQELSSSSEKTVAYPLREYWLDIGRLDEYERAQREFSVQ